MSPTDTLAVHVHTVRQAEAAEEGLRPRPGAELAPLPAAEQARGANTELPGRRDAANQAPAADEDDLDAVDLTICAEQALLGEVLHLAAKGQNAIPTLTRWGLVPSDFYRPYHQAVFQAMLTVSRVRRPPSPQEVLARLRADPDLPGHVARNGVRLVELMEATPGAGSLPGVAQMVIEASLRRLIERWSIRLTQVASRLEAAAGEVDAAALGEHLQTAAAQFADHSDRLRQMPGAERAAGAPPMVAPPREPAVPVADAAAARLEKELLASLVAYPAWIDSVAGFLRPEYLSPGLPRALYGVLLELRGAGTRVDVLTVAWQARRHGLPGADKVPTLLANGAPWPLDLARQIHAHAITALVVETARALHTLSSDLRSTPTQTLNYVVEAVTRLRRSVSDYQNTHGISATATEGQDQRAA